MTQVILADDQAIFRAGVARVLSQEHDLEVSAQCEDLPALKEAVQSQRDAVVVFASGLATDQVKLLRELDATHTRSVVVLEKGEELEEMLAMRVRGVVSRAVDATQLIDTVRRVAAGETCIPRGMVRRTQGRLVEFPSVQDPEGEFALSKLTPKEVQIVSLIAEGLKNREIARRLRTSEQVIKNYLRTVFDKIGVSDRLELALFALRHKAMSVRLDEVRLKIAK